jgi:hypothetical protein
MRNQSENSLHVRTQAQALAGKLLDPSLSNIAARLTEPGGVTMGNVIL